MKSSRLEYLEGIRGLAAMLVVVHHIVGHTLVYVPMDGWKQQFQLILECVFQGRPAVAVFIVQANSAIARSLG
jgi:peptidoglycan/LPS O-acetylase OafA/YrhL